MVDEAPARRPAAPTLELVAGEAGVSRGTASRVLSGSPQVSERAKTAVLAAAERLGYVPNLAARALVTKRSESVAFVVAEAEERFFADPFRRGQHDEDQLPTMLRHRRVRATEHRGEESQSPADLVRRHPMQVAGKRGRRPRSAYWRTAGASRGSLVAVTSTGRDARPGVNQLGARS
jgi:hypothetical protein